MFSKSDSCLEPPLGILCKCMEYQKVIKEFTSYNIGMQHPLLPKMNIEPLASAEVLWKTNRLTLSEDISKPIFSYSQIQPNINAYNVDKIWIPMLSDLIPLRSLKIYTWKTCSN